MISILEARPDGARWRYFPDGRHELARVIEMALAQAVADPGKREQMAGSILERLLPAEAVLRDPADVPDVPAAEPFSIGVRETRERGSDQMEMIPEP